jgi:pilus assembly protein CpaB
VPTGSFSRLQDLEGRVLRSNVQRGEPILEGRLAPVGTRGGLSAVIPGGKRAITVKVNEVMGVAGFALPGNHVDVMVHTSDQQQAAVSKIVLERILVLAIAQEASRDDTKPRVVNAVTLEVTPGEAEKLDLARSIGSLSLVLRNQIDTEPTPTAGIRKEDLLGKIVAPTPPSQAQQPQRPQQSQQARRAPPPPSLPRPIAGEVEGERPVVEVIRGIQKANSQL